MPHHGFAKSGFIVSLLLGAYCATVLAARVDVDFERVRVRVVEANLAPSRGSIAVSLPDVSRLDGKPVAIVLHLENRDPTPRTVRITLGGSELAEVSLAPSRRVRVDRSVPGSPILEAGDRFELSSDGDGWTLAYLELANVHGFSDGLFSFVIVPASMDRAGSVPPVAAVITFIVLLMLAARFYRPARRKAVRIAHRVVGAVVLAFFGLTLAASWVSPYEILLSPETFLLCTALLYYSAFQQAGQTAVARLTPLLPVAAVRILQSPVHLLYGAAFALFVVSVAGFYEADHGFTTLIRFGDQFDDRILPAVGEIPHHVIENSNGYDGQFYAQLAVDPLLLDPAIDRALDAASYRSRRILFSWTAFLLGLGQPHLILQAYALQNAAFWLLLAVLLCRWFPPRTVRHFALWFGCMFSHGMIVSVGWALPDGPSMLLLAVAIIAIERGRPLAAAALVGFAGLAKDINLVWSAILVRNGAKPECRSTAIVVVGRFVLVALPLAVWMLYLWLTNHDLALLAGSRNFAAPLTAYSTKWLATLAELQQAGWESFARFSLFGLISLTTQTLVLLRYRDWANPWWQAGIASCLLMMVLGPAVWEGHPGAATRVLLPMTFAFNLVLLQARWFWPLFALGNLTVLAALETIRAPFLWPYL